MLLLLLKAALCMSETASRDHVYRSCQPGTHAGKKLGFDKATRSIATEKKEKISF